MVFPDKQYTFPSLLTSDLMSLHLSIIARMPKALGFLFVIFVALTSSRAATIDSPTSLIECQPAALTWHNADPTGDVYISVLPNKDISAKPLIQFPPQKGTDGSLTWPKVNVTANSMITLVVNDA